MSVKFSIKDGQGKDIEACVKPVGKVTPKEHALCVNISGTSPGQSVTTSDSAAGGQTDVFLTKETSPGVPDMVTRNAAVEGTLGSPIVFSFQAIAGEDFVITDLIIIGIDTSIKINNWIGSNGPLINGCLLDIKADDDILTADPFQRTRDIAAHSSLAGFNLFSEQGGDLVQGFRQYKPLLVLRAKDAFGTAPGSDDFVSWTVQDSHAGIDEISIELRGFVVEPGTV